MQKKILKNWLKRTSIALFLMLSFSVATTYAAPSIPDVGSKQTSTTLSISDLGAADIGYLVGDDDSLEGGGSGLKIPTGEAQISGDISKKPFGELLVDIVNYFVGFLGIIAVIVFIYAGVLWVVAGGNEEQVGKSKKMMIYASLGIIVVIMSYSIVSFLTGAAGGGCADDQDCVDQFGEGYTCEAGICKSGPSDENGECSSSVDCAPGEWCSALGICVPGNDVLCESDSDCEPPKECDEIYGFCRNPFSSLGSSCEDNTDCPPYGFVCNEETNKCEMSGSDIAGAITGGESEAVVNEVFNNIDTLVGDLMNLLDGMEEGINSLPEDVKEDVLGILGYGTLADKMAGLESLMDATDDPAVLAVLERLLEALEKLSDLREELDDLREVMPESKDTIEAWDKTSEDLNALIDDPVSGIKLRRFEKEYRTLQELIRKFPAVQSRIKASPAEGNVPFTVILDGMDSFDPTGGTISDYKWSFIDTSGSLVSLGNSPVIVHELAEPNTYSIRLQVSTSQTDTDGYKTATDGVSYVRVRANPPASQVAFRINGVEVSDVYHVTLEESKAGIAFDPSITVPALGRVLERYEWTFGDTISEERTTPTTVIHSYSKAGEYFVTLKVTDNHGVSDKSIVKLFVKSLAANIEIRPTDGNVNTEFQFIGTNSRSDDGVIKDYEWKIEDKEGRTVAESEDENFYHRFDSPGEYGVILTITDTTGAKDKTLEVLEIDSRPPVASFIYSTPELNHPNRFDFSALSSYDPDTGDSITYSWDFDGDGNFDLVDTSDIRVTHEYKRVGEYRVTLQVEDAFGQRDQTIKGIKIDSILSGDAVLPKRAAQVGEEVIFKAVSPNAVAYLWEFGDSQTASTEETEVKYTYNKKGKYRVKLNFFDEEDNDNSDIVYMLIGDRDEPISVADVTVNGRAHPFFDDLCGEGKHGVVITRADSLQLTARDSINTDGSGRLLSYDWKLADGTRSSRKEFTHRFDEINREGECFSTSLIVRDQVSGKLSDEDVLYFKVINKLPTISDFVLEEEDKKELITPTKVKLRTINPKDSDGQIKKYRWWYYREGYKDEKLGVHATANPETEMVITAEGQPDLINRYYFNLQVIDNDGGVYDTIERFGELSYLDITNGPNLSPVAEFTVDKTTISVSDSITFISQSYDPQGDTLPNDAFRWDFDGDGEFDDSSTGAQVNRQYNTPGEYTVRLKVSYRGLSSSATKTIFVEQVQSLPQAAFTFDVDETTVIFDGNNSRYDSDLEDTTLRFEWDFNIQEDSNGNGIKDDDVESTEVSPSYTYSDLTIYRVRLKVKDSLGMEGVVVRDVDLSMSAEEREKSTYRSVRVGSINQPLTTLDIAVTPIDVPKGGTADVNVTIRNADNSPYYGQVFFEIMEGSGEFTPNPVDAKDSKASAIFTAIDSGPVRIKVRATGTYFGEIVEEAVINVK